MQAMHLLTLKKESFLMERWKIVKKNNKIIFLNSWIELPTINLQIPRTHVEIPRNFFVRAPPSTRESKTSDII